MLSERFYGMGEPLIQREADTGVMAAEYLDLVKAVGCTAYRSWMHLTDTLTDPVTPNEEAVAAQAVGSLGKLLQRQDRHGREHKGDPVEQPNKTNGRPHHGTSRPTVSRGRRI